MIVSGRERQDKSPGRLCSTPDGAQNVGRVLIVEGDSQTAATVDQACIGLGIPCDIARNVQEAVPLLEHVSYDIMVIGLRLTDGSGYDLKERLARNDPLARIIVIGAKDSYEDALAAMRSGAVDFVARPLRAAEMANRLKHACELVAQERLRDQKVQRLRQVCRKLKGARHDVTHQVDSLCNELVNAYQELADQITEVTTVTEFAAVIRQELDVEELLRSTLEYMLRRFGAMNAAVYLPGSGSDFTLGAYINYDCPKGRSDDLLDRLGDLVASVMLEENELREFGLREPITGALGDEAGWLGDSHVLMFTCRDAKEPLAIFVLFRNAQTPFSAEAIRLLGSLSEVFGRQLAHVIHVHHRHQPDVDEKHGWDIRRDDSDEDEGDRADDSGLAA